MYEARIITSNPVHEFPSDSCRNSDPKPLSHEESHKEQLALTMRVQLFP